MKKVNQALLSTPNIKTLVLLALTASVLSSCGGGKGGDGPDPGITDNPIAFVKRPLPLDNVGDPIQAEVRDPAAFNPGGDLFVKARATLSTPMVNVTGSLTGGLGDVKDLDVSYDGKTMVFSMQLPDPDPNDMIVPTWDIWEYNFASRALVQLINDNSAATQGFHDIGPHYLPDNRIIFSSTRQHTSGAVLLNEGKPAYSARVENENTHAFMLHVMDPNGDNLKQLSFSPGHDLDPIVLNNGQVLFSRWERALGHDAISLYRMNPDGTQLEMVYGSHDHASGTNGATIQYMQPRPMPDGRIMTLITPDTSTYVNNGDINTIRIADFIDNNQPTWANRGTLSGPAQKRITGNDITTDGSISPGGRFSSAYPLWDGTSRILVSWSPCKVVAAPVNENCNPTNLALPGAVEAPPAYGLWLYNYGNEADFSDDTQLPVVTAENDIVYSDVLAAQPRVKPPIIPVQIFKASWITEQVGALHIRSVYDFGNEQFDPCNARNIGGCTLPSDILSIADIADPDKGNKTADDRPARFLRISKFVPLPDPNDPALGSPIDLKRAAFGPTRRLGMREIVGYARIEPDGSVKVKIPANVPLNISILDKAGRRIGARHNIWLQTIPGETIECVGCHTHNTANNDPPLPHGRTGATAASINVGASADFAPFPNSVANLFADNQGETMAEAHTLRDPAVLTPSIDVVFIDDWTDAAVRTPDAAFSYTYGNPGGLSTAIPITTLANCSPNWSSNCRVVINYEEHIDPMWQVVRPDGPDAGTADDTCLDCHTNVDINNNNVARVPDGQLDLDDKGGDATNRIVSVDDPDVLKSYRELLFNDNQQILDGGGNLVDELIDPLDPTTTIIVNRSMSQSGANSSNLFFNVFAPGGTHEGRLSPAELRLISEWLDIGAQNFNNPHDPDVPVN